MPDVRHTVESLNILETLGLISGIFYSTIASGDVNSLTLRCGVLHVQQFVKYSVVETYGTECRCRPTHNTQFLLLNLQFLSTTSCLRNYLVGGGDGGIDDRSTAEFASPTRGPNSPVSSTPTLWGSAFNVIGPLRDKGKIQRPSKVKWESKFVRCVVHRPTPMKDRGPLPSTSNTKEVATTVEKAREPPTLLLRSFNPHHRFFGRSAGEAVGGRQVRVHQSKFPRSNSPLDLTSLFFRQKKSFASQVPATSTSTSSTAPFTLPPPQP